MNTFSHVVWPAVAIVVMVVVTRLKGLSWRDDLGWRWPPLRQGLLWLGLFLIVAIAEETAGRFWGVDPAQPWGSRYSGLELATRVLAMVVLAPLAEEMLFRGLLFRAVSRSRLGPLGAVFVTAVLFAALHFQYYGAALLLVLVDGLFLGAARYATGSMLLTLLFHSLGNLYAAYERLAG